MNTEYYLLTPKGREGPYSEEDLLDLLDGNLATRLTWCENAQGQRMQLRQIFETIEPEAKTYVAAPPVDSPFSLEKAGPGVPSESSQNDAAAAPDSILLQTRSSILIYWRSFMAALACVGAGYLLASRSGAWLLGGLLMAGVILGWAYFRRSLWVFLATASEVEAVHRMFAKKSRSLALKEVSSVVHRKAGFWWLFGVGSVGFVSTKTNRVEIIFANIPRARQVAEAVRNLHPQPEIPVQRPPARHAE